MHGHWWLASPTGFLSGVRTDFIETTLVTFALWSITDTVSEHNLFNRVIDNS